MAGKKEVNITISADDKTARGFRSAEKGIGGLDAKLGRLAYRYSGLIGVLGGTAAFINVINSTKKWSGEVEKLTQMTGMSAESASKMLYTTKAMGVQFGDVASATKDLSKKVSEAKRSIDQASASGKTSTDVFTRYGIKITDTGGKLRDYDTIMKDVTATYQSLNDGMEKNAFSDAVFGGSGEKMREYLNLTSDQLEQYAAKAERAGLVTREGLLKDSKELEQATRELELSLTGLKVQLGAGLVPMLKKTAEYSSSVLGYIRSLPEPVKDTTMAMAGLTGGMLALGSAWRTLIALGNPLLGTLAAISAGIGLYNSLHEASEKKQFGNKVTWYDGAEIFQDPKYITSQNPEGYAKKQLVIPKEATYATDLHGNITTEVVQPTVGAKVVQPTLGELEQIRSQSPQEKARREQEARLREAESIMANAGMGGGGLGGKSAIDAARELQKALHDINKGIAAETGSIFESSQSAVKDQLEKLKLEIQSAKEQGLDTTEAQAKYQEYEAIMTEKLQREQRERKARFTAEMLGMDAEYFGDRKKLIEADYLAAMAGLEKEKLEKYRQVGDKEQADLWYSARVREIEKKRQADLAAESRTESERNLTRIGLLGELENKTQGEILRIKRQGLENHIALLKEQLRQEHLTADERLRIEQELANNIRSLRENQGHDPSMAFAEGLRRIKDQTHDYAADVVNTYNSIFGSFEENIASAIDGSKSFSAAMKDMADSVIKDMIRMYVRMLMNMALAKMFGGSFGGAGSSNLSPGASAGNALAALGRSLPGFASGGVPPKNNWFMVGEEGPEILQVGSASRVYSNQDSRSLLNGTGNSVGPIEIRVINQTSQEASVTRQEANFDGAKMVVTMWMEGMQRNVCGVRDMVSTIGGAR